MSASRVVSPPAREWRDDDVEIGVRLSDGRWAEFPAWRSRCDLPGHPSMGIVRFAAEVADDSDAAAARAGALQCAAFHLPYGGACGGIAQVPDTASPADLDRICLAFYRAFPDMALCAPRCGLVGSGTLPAGWLTGERHALRWSGPGAWYQVADPVREDAVALGTLAALRRFHPRPGSWALDGWDRTAQVLARHMAAAGWRLVAAGDGRAAVGNCVGLSPSELTCAMAAEDGLAALVGDRGSRDLETPWVAGAEVVVVAGGGRFDKRALAHLRRGATVVELVPDSCDPAAEAGLAARDGRVIPHMVASGGAPILAHLRHLQRRHRCDWSAAALRARLLQRFTEGLAAIAERDADLRAAALTTAHDFTAGLRNGPPVYPL